MSSDDDDDDDESWGSDDRRPSWTVPEQTLGLLLIMRMKSKDLTLFVLIKPQCPLCEGGGTLGEQAGSFLWSYWWLWIDKQHIKAMFL